ncbi:hypothetical protein Lal_00039046 [Lupinus albus]|nr:hypothetical protein Lal_00039046 [Lupinus albus]
MTSGSLMMFYMKEVYTFGHGVETATKLLGSTPHDQLLIKTSDSFSGLLLLAIGFLLFMVSFVKDRDFQPFFAKGCMLLHVFMVMWRIYFERKVEDLAWDCLRQTVGDVLLALSWLFFLVYSWREKAIAWVDLHEAIFGHHSNLTSPSSSLCILHQENVQENVDKVLESKSHIAYLIVSGMV